MRSEPREDKSEILNNKILEASIPKHDLSSAIASEFSGRFKITAQGPTINRPNANNHGSIDDGAMRGHQWGAGFATQAQ